MAPRTRGEPLVGEAKMDTNSEEYKALVDGHADGSLNAMTPAIFYELNPDVHRVYTLKALQTAWSNAKRLAGNKAASAASGKGYAVPPPAGNVVESKPLVSTEKASKRAKYDEEEEQLAKEQEAIDSIDQVSQLWHPLVSKWQWTRANGHRMIAIKFCPTAGMSPGTTAGIDIHAIGASCSITADWPKEFYDLECVRKYYGEKALKDLDVQRMLNAEEDHLKQLMLYADETPRATVVIPLDFPVIETRNPESNVVSIKGTGTRMITIQLASTNVPNFAAKQVVEDAVFD